MYKAELGVPPAEQIISSYQGSHPAVKPVDLSPIKTSLNQRIFSNDQVLKQYEKFPSHIGSHAHEYDLVVADDTSGRLPGIVAWRYINYLRHWRGLEHAKLGFVTPIGAAPSPHFYRTVSCSTGVALIVTERIGFGDSVRKISKCIPNRPVDILTIQNVHQLVLPWARNTFTTEVPYKLDQEIFNLPPRFSGVKKNIYSDYAHSESFPAHYDTRSSIRKSARLIAEALALGTIDQIASTTKQKKIKVGRSLLKLS